jgi:hypothetical protein
MRLSTWMTLLALTLLIAASMVSAQHKPAKPKADPITGDWNASLNSEANATGFTLTLKLKLNHSKVTGSYESDHVGSGQITKGAWAANKLSLTLATNHGAFALTGELKHGKLAGKFDAGQMQGNWEANKK